MINEDTEKKREILVKLKEFSSTEVINKYGIMEGSVITVSIIEARDLKLSSKLGFGGGTPNAYVLVSVD